MTIHWGLKTRNDRSVLETEQYLYCFLPLIHRLVQLSWARSHNSRRIFFLLYGGSQTYKCITAPYLSNGPLTLLTEIVDRVSMVHLRDRWRSYNVIDCHYMTDRLQRFELKIFICVLLKKQSHLHLGCPGGKQINIKFSFLGELSL